MLTENEIKAKAYVIGKQLAREQWYNMPFTKAENYCRQKALAMHADSKEAEVITMLAIMFVVDSEG